MILRFPYDKRHLNFGNSTAVLDDAALNVLKQLNKDINTVVYDQTIDDKFRKSYLQWILSSKLNSIKGLDQFKYSCYSNGTTESFDKFYLKNNSRRFRCFRGEYMYHQLAWRNYWPNWKFINDEPLDKNDAVVVSLPFADTGNEHKDYQHLLLECVRLGIPVLVDCAYFGICQDINFDFTSPCITDITFSLSKTFPVSHIRIGIRFSKYDDDDSLFVVNKGGYINRLGAYIGLEFLTTFQSDYIPNKYRNKQEQFCRYLAVTPSRTILFGIGDNMWQEYNRGTDTNRLSFHKYFHLDFEKFTKDNLPSV